MSVSDVDAKQARRLLDILNYSRKAVSIASGVELVALRKDETRKLALERCFEVIGEAARHVTPETAAKVGGLPLDKMRGMRNLISHDYLRVQPADVLRTAQVNLPLVLQQLEPLEKDLCLAANLQLPPS